MWGGHSSSSCLPQPVLSLRDHISYNSYISHSYFFEIYYIFLRPSSQRVFVATSWGQGPWKRDLRKRVVTSTAEIWCIPHTLEDKQEMEDWPNWILGSLALRSFNPAKPLTIIVVSIQPMQTYKVHPLSIMCYTRYLAFACA